MSTSDRGSHLILFREYCTRMISTRLLQHRGFNASDFINFNVHMSPMRYTDSCYLHLQTHVAALAKPYLRRSDLALTTSDEERRNLAVESIKLL